MKRLLRGIGRPDHATQPRTRGFMAPIDYSRFDNIDTSSDEDDTVEDTEEDASEDDDDDDILASISAVIEKIHDRKATTRSLSPSRATMSSQSDMPVPDTNQPSFNPNLDIATEVFSHVQCVRTRLNLAQVSRVWRDASVQGLPDLKVLRVLGEAWPKLKQDEREIMIEQMVRIGDGRVVELKLQWLELSGALPAEIGQLTSLELLYLGDNQLTSVPADIGQLTSLEWLELQHNQLTIVPADIGQLTSLQRLNLHGNRLTSVPVEIGQLTSLRQLSLNHNQLTSVPAEIGQLTSLETLYLSNNQLTIVPSEIGQLAALKVLLLAHNQLTSLPAEIGQLRSLRELYLDHNQLTSVPAEIWQLTSLRYLYLNDNRLTSVPAAIRGLRAAGCYVTLDRGVTVDE